MKTRSLLSIAALFWLLAPQVATGQESPGPFQGWEALSAAELAVERGGEETELPFFDLVDMGAFVQDNTIVNSQSGNNHVDGGAFNGASGFSTIIQNSGHHVIIQNATIVNLTIER